MKCQRCGCNIDKVVPFEDNHGIKDNTIYTIKTEKIVNGVIVDFRIFFVCKDCWESALEVFPHGKPKEAALRGSIVIGESPKTEY